MKKTFLFSILILLLASQGLCQSGVVISGSVLSGAGGGAATPEACPTGVSDASIFCEDWQKVGGDCGDSNHTNCRVTWTITNATGSTVDYNSAISGTIAGKVNNSTLDITDGATSSSPDGRPTTTATFTAVDEAYTQLYFNLLTNLAADTNNFKIIGNDVIALSAVRTDATHYKINLSYYSNAGNWTSNMDSSKTDYALNTWYGIRVYWKKNTVNVPTWSTQRDVSIDTWTSETASSGTTHGTAQFDEIHTGVGNTFTSLARWQLLNIKVNATGYPSATSP